MQSIAETRLPILFINININQSNTILMEKERKWNNNLTVFQAAERENSAFYGDILVYNRVQNLSLTYSFLIVVFLHSSI